MSKYAYWPMNSELWMVTHDDKWRERKTQPSETKPTHSTPWSITRDMSTKGLQMHFPLTNVCVVMTRLQPTITVSTRASPDMQRGRPAPIVGRVLSLCWLRNGRYLVSYAYTCCALYFVVWRPYVFDKQRPCVGLHYELTCFTSSLNEWISLSLSPPKHTHTHTQNKKQYVKAVLHPSCAAEHKRLVEPGPPINLRDPKGLPVEDEGIERGEVKSFWHASDGSTHSAKLKGKSHDVLHVIS